jgi:hypothetical protein
MKSRGILKFDAELTLKFCGQDFVGNKKAPRAGEVARGA